MFLKITEKFTKMQAEHMIVQLYVYSIIYL